MAILNMLCAALQPFRAGTQHRLDYCMADWRPLSSRVRSSGQQRCMHEVGASLRTLHRS